MKPSIVPTLDEAPRTGRGTALQQLGRRLFLAKLAGLREGELTVVEGGESSTFGRRTPGCNLRATIEILHPQTYADAAFGGTVGAGEAYIGGLWRADDLTALIRLMIVNRDVMQSMEGGAAIATVPLRRLLHWINRNSPDGSRRNIAAEAPLDLVARRRSHRHAAVWTPARIGCTNRNRVQRGSHALRSAWSGRVNPTGPCDITQTVTGAA